MKSHATAPNEFDSSSLCKVNGDTFSLEEGEGLALCGKPKHLKCCGIPAQQELSHRLHLPSQASVLTANNRNQQLGFVQITAGIRCSLDTEF